MTRATQPAVAPARGGDLASAAHSWRIGPELQGASESSPDSRLGDSTGLPGSWFDSHRLAMPTVVDAFTEAWERGEAPAIADYLDHLDPADSLGAVELIYREYCLAEADGQGPDPSAYLDRFPRYRQALDRLLHLHGACSTSLLGRWIQPEAADPGLPEAGDSIGPYLLRRELGRGSFARVFLAEQADLENRPIVVKVSTRATREPWLLARARHAHIVEIVSHALVDDGAFQLICMPFFGGATLAAVLAARRRQSRAATSGRDLLADLDGVAAPEYLGAATARPAREVLARLPYDRAIAWIVARLAEALDHAFSRDVAHGDVKPSNILLTADGNPMLLDFNLARDGAPALDGAARAIDLGGTLAYMAPERLRALADRGPHGGDIPGSELGPEPEPDPSPADEAPHRADLYALGMVLLEAMTGRTPLAVEVPEALDPTARRCRLRSAARVYAAARDRSARSIVRDSAIAGGRRIAPGLRAILERCLDPDPVRRYRRASELAEDLDRWRTDRPLAFADEPFWGQTIRRWLRRRRRVLGVAAVSMMAVALATTALVLRGSNLVLYQNLEAKALGKLARLWDDPEARTYREHRAQTLRLLRSDEPWVIEAARRALGDYDILGPGDVFGTGDWRRRDDVRRLPAADREDLELWILERVYRYCRALDERPDSPGDWEQALRILDGACSPVRIPAFTPLRARLLAKLNASPPPALSSTVPAPPWLDEHLLGFVAECEPDAADMPPALGSADVMEIIKAEALRQRRAAERALRHYSRSLALRPDSYWGHYRAAGMCYGLGRTAEAAGHLERCLGRRPANPALRGQLAGCLIALQRYAEALPLCDQALERAPEHAEFYRTRAYLRAKLDQTGGLAEDLRHFEMLRSHARDPLRSLEHDEPWFRAELAIAPWSARLGSRDEAGELAPEEILVRLRLADELHRAGDFAHAEAELDRILSLDPDHFPARMARVEHAVKARQFDAARREFDAVLNHPKLLDYLRATPDSFTPFFKLTNLYLKAGMVDEAGMVARRARDLAIQVERDVAKSQYNLAQVYAVMGRLAPHFIKDAAEQLFQAFVAGPYFRQWYREDRWWLEPVRFSIDAELRRLEDSPAAPRRLAAPRPARG